MTPKPTVSHQESLGSSRKAASQLEHPLAENNTSRTTSLGETNEVTSAFDPEKYVPRVLAPEAAGNLAAMRELANSSARTAINVSSLQRRAAAVLIKLAISGVGLFVAVVLLAINGLNFNIGLLATFASIVVCIIWGYDGVTSLKPLLEDQTAARLQHASSDDEA